MKSDDFLEWSDQPMIGHKDRMRGMRIKDAIKSSGLKQNELARKAGVTPQAVTRWTKTGQIARAHLSVLAKATGHTFEWIDHGSGQRLAAGQNVHYGVDIQRYVPLISWVQAGNWCRIDHTVGLKEGQKRLPCPVSCGPMTFVLRVEGSSMEPDYLHDDYIFVDPDVAPTHGKDVVVTLTDTQQAVFKRLIVEGQQSFLMALNPHFPERIVKLDNSALICGVVVFSGRER
jgi:SOS-response transcriptional repressor LexA